MKALRFDGKELSVADVPEIQGRLVANGPSAARGRQLARQIVTLPTHPFVRAEDVRRIAGVLGRLRS